MENRELIPITDFILEHEKSFEVNSEGWAIDYIDSIFKYANFIKQPLKVEMFVPCDEYGDVLEEPKYYNPNKVQLGWAYERWEKAKEKVLFEGFEVCNRNSEMNCVVHKNFHLNTGFKHRKTIEDLTSYGLTLTPSAIKQIGL